MAKPTNKLNTDVVQKTDEDQVIVAAATDPEIQALAEASAQAAAQAEQAAQERATKKVQLNTQVNANPTKSPSVGESAELIAAVKADAEKRGKDFSICPISGVMVVG